MVQLMPLHPQTPSSLASFKSRLVLLFYYRLTQVVLEKRSLIGCSSVVAVYMHSTNIRNIAEQHEILTHPRFWKKYLLPNHGCTGLISNKWQNSTPLHRIHIPLPICKILICRFLYHAIEHTPTCRLRHQAVIFSLLYNSPNSPRLPMFKNTDGISKHRLSPYTSVIYITNITFYFMFPVPAVI